MKDSKEIVENILRMKSLDYELTDHSDIVTSRKSILVEQVAEQEVNVLPQRMDDEAQGAEEEATEQGENITIEDMETYQPIQEIDFEVSEVKEGFEKKKKRRNYIEFRPDYSKIV